jgi:hypothetical protein
MTCGAVGDMAVTGTATDHEILGGEPVRRRTQLLDEAYRQVGDIAEQICVLQGMVADVDDDQLSIDLNELQQAVLQIDRHLRTRRAARTRGRE